MDPKFDLPATMTELLYGNESSEPLERTLDRLLTDDCVQRVNGRVYRRSEFAAHVREARQVLVGGGDLRVLEQISTGNHIAGRYLFRMVMADGQTLYFESHIFAEVNGGRMARLVEVARQVGEDDDDDFLVDTQSE